MLTQQHKAPTPDVYRHINSIPAVSVSSLSHSVERNKMNTLSEEESVTGMQKMESIKSSIDTEKAEIDAKLLEFLQKPLGERT